MDVFTNLGVVAGVHLQVGWTGRRRCASEGAVTGLGAPRCGAGASTGAAGALGSTTTSRAAGAARWAPRLEWWGALRRLGPHLAWWAAPWDLRPIWWASRHRSERRRACRLLIWWVVVWYEQNFIESYISQGTSLRKENLCFRNQCLHIKLSYLFFACLWSSLLGIGLCLV